MDFQSKKFLMTAGGVVFLLIGLLGLINDPVLGIFEVDFMHNLVHLGSGVAATVFGMGTEKTAKLGGQVFALVYALITVLGFITGEGQLLGLMQINMADNFLHLFLTVYFAYVGFAPEPRLNVRT